MCTIGLGHRRNWLVGTWASRYYWRENHHILPFFEPEFEGLVVMCEITVVANQDFKHWPWPWFTKVWLRHGLQTDLGLAVLSGLEVITLWTVGLKGCTTFGPTSLTSDHTIAHLPSFPRSIHIKRFKVNSDFGFIWIPFIIENWKYCYKIIFKYVNSIVGPSFKVFLLNKVLTGPVNSAQDPLEKHNFAENTFLFLHYSCGSHIWKRETQTKEIFNAIQTNTLYR